MAGRSGSTFSKRQKERARQEKQREKAERKRLRKLESKNRPPGEEFDTGSDLETGFGSGSEEAGNEHPVEDSPETEANEV